MDPASWPLIQTFGAERFLAESSRARLLLANEAEARALSGDTDALSAARRLSSVYEAVCVKRGPAGALVIEKGLEYEPLEPSPVMSVDSTGAGDAFDGVFIAALAGGAGVHEALRPACDAGATCASSDEVWPER